MDDPDDPTLHDIAARILAGDVRVLSRAITWVERGDRRGNALLRRLYPHGGRAWVIGITGVPGAGKSTTIPRLTEHFSADGGRCAVLAVDPSSPFTGGAILGDRLRSASDRSNRIYFRSLGSRGAAGGLARCIAEVIDLLDAAGFGVVLVETVGAGQSEVAIGDLAHTVMVLTAPGLGDDVQAMKAGILEIGSIHVVNKADREEARNTQATLRGVLRLAPRRHGMQDGCNDRGNGELAWMPPVVAVSALRGDGLDGLYRELAAHRDFLDRSGGFARATAARGLTRLHAHARDLALARFWRDGEAQGWVERGRAKVAQRLMDPLAAAEEMVEAAFGPATPRPAD
jgi:LAO/AO transport system kinase